MLENWSVLLGALACCACAWLRPRRVNARGTLTIGTGGDRRPVRLPSGANSGSHTLIVGATGSGKTVTEALMLDQAIARGHAAVVVDPKGDRLLRETARRAAIAAGRRFIEWTPDGPAIYNPYGHGSPSEIADKALAAERWSEPHYQRQAQRYLATVGFRSSTARRESSSTSRQNGGNAACQFRVQFSPDDRKRPVAASARFQLRKRSGVFGSGAAFGLRGEVRRRQATSRSGGG